MLLQATVALLVGFLVMLLANFVTTVYLHRALTHKAMTVRAPLSFVFRVLTWLLTGIRPRQWVAVHRKHHAFTDEEGDPHSPLQLGWVTVQLKNVFLYRRAARNPSVVDRYAKDLPATRLDRFLLDHAVIGLGALVAILWVAGLGAWSLLAATFHFLLYLALSGSVNSIGHTFGRRHHDNTATNLQWLAMLTWGEGLHNNHHAAPTSARFSLQSGEYDPAWAFISLMQKLGLVHIRHTSPVFVTPTASAPSRHSHTST